MLMKITYKANTSVFGFVRIFNTKEWKQVKFFTDEKEPLELIEIKLNSIVLMLYDQCREVVNNKGTYKDFCNYVLYEGQAIYIPGKLLKEVKSSEDL